MHLQTSLDLPWFALYVKSRHEKHVASVITGKGFECFVPTYLKRSTNGKKSELPLFPGYVFSRFEPNRTYPIVSTSGVFSIVGNGDGHEPIPDDQIRGIKEMVAGGYSPRPWPYLAPGQAIYISEGPLQGVTGVVVTATDERWLVVSVHLLHRSIAVKLDRGSLSPGAITRVQSTSGSSLSVSPA